MSYLVHTQDQCEYLLQTKGISKLWQQRLLHTSVGQMPRTQSLQRQRPQSLCSFWHSLNTDWIPSACKVLFCPLEIPNKTDGIPILCHLNLIEGLRKKTVIHLTLAFRQCWVHWRENENLEGQTWEWHCCQHSWLSSWSLFKSKRDILADFVNNQWRRAAPVAPGSPCMALHAQRLSRLPSPCW